MKTLKQIQEKTELGENEASAEVTSRGQQERNFFTKLYKFDFSTLMYVKDLMTPEVNKYIEIGILSFRCQVRHVIAIHKKTGGWRI